MREKKSVLVAAKKNAVIDSIQVLLTPTYNVLTAASARACVISADQRQPNLMLIGVDLPGLGTPALIKNLRKYTSAPIIMLSESPDESDMVRTLDAGANDVLVLPFGKPLHLAKIRAALRLSPGKLGCVSSGKFVFGGLMINYDTRTVEVDGRKVHLTPIEFRIMTLLTVNAGKVLTHDHIINEIWGPYNSDNLVLRVNMANIRRKIEVNPTEPKYIVTEVGVGYRVVCE